MEKVKHKHTKLLSKNEDLIEYVEDDYFQRLSVEIICQILGCLPLKDILKLSSQCKKFNHAVTMYLKILKSIDFTEGYLDSWMPSSLSDNDLMALIPKCKELQFIYGFHPCQISKRRLRGKKGLSIPGVLSALNYATKLKGIEISNIFLLGAVLNYFPSLKIIGAFRNRMEELHLDNRFQLTVNPEVTSLHLTGVVIPELPKMDSLKYLYLNMVKITHPQPFREFLVPNLHTFVMSNCSGPEDALAYVRLLAGLATARSLSRLELANVPFLGGMIQDIVEDTWRENGFRNLTTVLFSGCKNALELDLGYLLITAAEKLKELSIQPSLTKDSLFSALKMADVSFSNFKSLSLGYVDPLREQGDASIFDIGDMSTESPAMITDGGMKSVGRTFESVVTMEIYNCPHLIFPCAWFSPNAVCWAYLQHLVLRRCHSLKLENFITFISHLPRLEVLQLEYMFREPPKGCSRVGLSAGTGLGVWSALVLNHGNDIIPNPGGEENEGQGEGDEQEDEDINNNIQVEMDRGEGQEDQDQPAGAPLAHNEEIDPEEAEDVAEDIPPQILGEHSEALSVPTSNSIHDEKQTGSNERQLHRSVPGDSTSENVSGQSDGYQGDNLTSEDSRGPSSSAGACGESVPETTDKNNISFHPSGEPDSAMMNDDVAPSTSGSTGVSNDSQPGCSHWNNNPVKRKSSENFKGKTKSVKIVPMKSNDEAVDVSSQKIPKIEDSSSDEEDLSRTHAQFFPSQNQDYSDFGKYSRIPPPNYSDAAGMASGAETINMEVPPPDYNTAMTQGTVLDNGLCTCIANNSNDFSKENSSDNVAGNCNSAKIVNSDSNTNNAKLCDNSKPKNSTTSGKKGEKGKKLRTSSEKSKAVSNSVEPVKRRRSSSVCGIDSFYADKSCQASSDEIREETAKSQPSGEQKGNSKAQMPKTVTRSEQSEAARPAPRPRGRRRSIESIIKRKKSVHHKSTSTSDPVMEEDHLQVMVLRSDSLVSVKLHMVGITDLIIEDCPKLTFLSGSGCRVLSKVTLYNAPKLAKTEFVQCRKLDQTHLVNEVCDQISEKNRTVFLRPMHQFNPRDFESFLFQQPDICYYCCIIYDYSPCPNQTLYNRMRVNNWMDLFNKMNIDFFRCFDFVETSWYRMDAVKYPWKRDIYRLKGLNDNGSKWELITDIPWIKMLSQCPDIQHPRQCLDDYKDGLYCRGAKGHFTKEDAIDSILLDLAEFKAANRTFYCNSIVVYFNMCDTSGVPKPDYFI